MIIVHACSPRLTLNEADMFTLLLERQHDLISWVSSAPRQIREGRQKKKKEEVAVLGVERSQIRRVLQSQ